MNAKTSVRGIGVLPIVVVVVIVAIVAIGAVILMQSPTPTTTTTQTTTTTTTTQPTTTTTTQAPLKVGVILYGYHDSGSWDPMCAQSVTNLIGKGYNLDVRFAEGVQITDLLDTARMLSRECDLIYISTEYYEDVALTVAPEFPNVNYLLFHQASPNLDLYPSNVLTMHTMEAILEAPYLSGIVAGAMTTTGKVGYVDAFPGPLPDHMASAFREGVWYSNPTAEVNRTIVGSYSDPVKAKDAVTSFVELGCDVVYNGLDDKAVLEEAQAQGIYAVAVYFDDSESYPNTVVASTIWNFEKAVKLAVDLTLAGTFKEYVAEHPEVFLSLGPGEFDCIAGKMVPANVVATMEDIKAKLVSGELVLDIPETW